MIGWRVAVLLVVAWFGCLEGCRLLSLGLQPAGYYGSGAASTRAGAAFLVVGVVALGSVVVIAAGRRDLALALYRLDRTPSARSLPLTGGVAEPTLFDARNSPTHFPTALTLARSAAKRHKMVLAVVRLAALLATGSVIVDLLLIPTSTLSTSVWCFLLSAVLELAVVGVAVDRVWTWRGGERWLFRESYEQLLLQTRAQILTGRWPKVDVEDVARGYWTRILPTASSVMTIWTLLGLAGDDGIPRSLAIGALAAFSRQSLLYVQASRLLRRPRVESGVAPDLDEVPRVVESRDTVAYDVGAGGITVFDPRGQNRPVGVPWTDVLGLRVIYFLPGAPSAIALLRNEESVLLFGEDIAGRVLLGYRQHAATAPR